MLQNIEPCIFARKKLFCHLVLMRKLEVSIISGQNHVLYIKAERKEKDLMLRTRNRKRNFTAHDVTK